MLFKEKVHQQAIILLQEKIRLLQTLLDELRETGANETKSTAGDKHETALAMIQLEQEGKRHQLQQLTIMMDALLQIHPQQVGTTIGKGSLVKTNRGYFFISAAIGKITIDGIPVMCISPISPLGTQLNGLTAGQEQMVHTTTYMIEEVI